MSPTCWCWSAPFWTALALCLLRSASCPAWPDDPAADAPDAAVEVVLPEQIEPLPFAPATMASVEDAIQLSDARAFVERSSTFRLDGRGTTVAVLDSGLNLEHLDFAQDDLGEKVSAQVNFTGDGGGAATDVSDFAGHGSHVSGIICGHGHHVGIAPMARIVPLKVLAGDEARLVGWGTVRDALAWVLANREEYGISVVNLSISDGTLRGDDRFLAGSVHAEIADLVGRLKQQRVVVVVAAGNDYAKRNKFTVRERAVEGMGFPAVVRDCISVGAIYEEYVPVGHDHSPYQAASRSVVRYQITPFSNRLHSLTHTRCQTDVFAPGGRLTLSTGAAGPVDESRFVHGGTSQAAPVVSGVVLLLQQYYLSAVGELPRADLVEDWIREGQPILDGDDEHDDVRHTCRTFVRLDVNLALRRAQADIEEVLGN